MRGKGHSIAKMTREDRHLSTSTGRNRDATASQIIRAVCPNVNLMKGNTRPNRDHWIDEFLEPEDIPWIGGPARSPHLIPIEHA
ncbi:hypothetical protein TNCV_1633491 [Trichonephila clavipes]|nr:hypothetical protein TNCV_1633491 [Trichonephila clavipes]